MSRSPKALPPLQDSMSDTQQLSLFAGRDKSSEQEISSIEVEPMTRSKKGQDYTAADIQVLQGIAHIRHRPGMYIGSTSTSGLLHLIWEALDNAVDEAVAGFG